MSEQHLANTRFLKMKTDNYLTMCLEQASNSPLHYRHGCIIVRGGKVIGQGYNDYRPGFNGGALKSGRLATTTIDGPALAEMKKKRKEKLDLKPATTSSGVSSTFVPFEGMNTGSGSHLANVPLSMHSEMMAIQSALAASYTSASTAMLSQKPCFKLSGHSKRKARLRREALQSYVERVCNAATVAQQSGAEQGSGKAYVQEWYFETSASQPDAEEPECREREGEVRGRSERPQGPGWRVSAGEEGEELSSRERRVSVPVSWLEPVPWSTTATSAQAVGA